MPSDVDAHAHYQSDLSCKGICLLGNFVFIGRLFDMWWYFAYRDDISFVGSKLEILKMCSVAIACSDFKIAWQSSQTKL